MYCYRKERVSAALGKRFGLFLRRHASDIQIFSPASHHMKHQLHDLYLKHLSSARVVYQGITHLTNEMPVDGYLIRLAEDASHQI